MVMAERLCLELANVIRWLCNQIDRPCNAWYKLCHLVQCMSNIRLQRDYSRPYSSFDALLCHLLFHIYNQNKIKYKKIPLRHYIHFQNIYICIMYIKNISDHYGQVCESFKQPQWFTYEITIQTIECFEILL